MAEPVLSAQGVTMRFGDFTALSEVSVSIRPGSMTGLIGPNGAGKTTLFNILAGALRPSAGRVLLSGADVTRQTPDQRFAQGLGRTFQIPKPFARMSVLENVMLAPLAQAGERIAGAFLFPSRVREDEARRNETLLDAYLGAPVQGYEDA
jgi:branched-chain amino acid transport system ATP-binding protein